ncbi:hypothetical protein [Cochleicola gelatinilyticus]|uniref:Uncharacterized protein n=1 Tax=Cochleicola gelatinilyticus TaxID=1763537 RepID=A0A167IK94_9FLAO|nr:hypothetical protein [Cochleicola gelatinilyticus]OAB79741.1 hypothetical protein ULVI_03070 [Cochleicola gelatinilyticus]
MQNQATYNQHGLGKFSFRSLWKNIRETLDNFLVTSIIMDFIDAFSARGGETLPEHLQRTFSIWLLNVLEPLTFYIAINILDKNTPEIVLSSLIPKFNDKIKEIYALKAYYEFQLLKSQNENENLMNQEKVSTIAESLRVLLGTYEEIIRLKNANLELVEYQFNPISYKRIGTDFLNWNGISEATATGYKVVSKSNNSPTGGTPPDIIETNTPGLNTDILNNNNNQGPVKGGSGTGPIKGDIETIPNPTIYTPPIVPIQTTTGNNTPKVPTQTTIETPPINPNTVDPGNTPSNTPTNEVVSEEKNKSKLLKFGAIGIGLWLLLKK